MLQGQWSGQWPRPGIEWPLVLIGKPSGEARREDPAETVEGRLHFTPAMLQTPLFNEELNAISHRNSEVLRDARDEQDDDKDYDSSRAGPVDASDAMNKDLTRVTHQGAR